MFQVIANKIGLKGIPFLVEPKVSRCGGPEVHIHGVGYVCGGFLRTHSGTTYEARVAYTDPEDGSEDVVYVLPGKIILVSYTNSGDAVGVWEVSPKVLAEFANSRTQGLVYKALRWLGVLVDAANLAADIVHELKRGRNG